MSVGGRVIETIVCADRVWVNTREPGSGHECAIFITKQPESLSISEGDSIWWQGQHAYWTPRRRPFSDRQLRRIGCSGVPRPVDGVPV